MGVRTRDVCAPTIPLADWRLAVDLGATRAIAAIPGRPAVGCPCPWCRNWRAVYARVLPSELREALERVGVVLAQPTDLYPSSPEAPCGVMCQCFGLGWVPANEAPRTPAPPASSAPQSEPTRFEARVRACLESGERLLYAEENRTFHRPLDFGVAVSDRALYVPRWSVRPYVPFRRGLRRVPLAQAEAVVLSPHRVLGARVVGLALLALALAVVGAALVPPLPARWVVPVLIAIFLFFARRLRWPTKNGRWVLAVSLAGGRTVRCVSLPDSFADEREFDRGVLRGALTACRLAGVPVVRDDTREAKS